MKVGIIGAGNMGGALARGLASNEAFPDGNIRISNRSKGKLEVLKSQFPSLFTTTVNQEAVEGADVIVLAVEPDQVPAALGSITVSPGQLFVSLVAGISSARLCELLGNGQVHIIRVVPNTAMTVGHSMTLISAPDATEEEISRVEQIFSLVGETLVVGEDKLSAATSLSSCGIAYAMKFMDAAVTAGVHMGLSPSMSRELIAQTLEGAARIIHSGKSFPSEEVLKVCTPGGLTIKGVKALEDGGFPSAVIAALLASRS